MASNRARPAFTQADRNRDGVLDRHEFRNFMNFESADRNRDGRLNVQEFARHAAPKLHVRPQQTNEAFRLADIDGNGFLDREELADFADFQRADRNHDGRVDSQEMRDFLNADQRRDVDPRRNRPPAPQPRPPRPPPNNNQFYCPGNRAGYRY